MFVIKGFPTMKSVFRRTLPFMVTAGIGIASLATAQTVSDNAAVPTTALNLPSTLSTFGKVEPNLRNEISEHICRK